MTEQLQEYYFQGKFEEIVEMTSDINTSDLSETILYRIKSLRELNNFEEGKKLIDETLQLLKENKEMKEYKAKILIEYLYLLYKINDFSNYVETDGEILKIMKNIGEEGLDADYLSLWYYIKGNYQRKNNKIEDARMYYDRSYEIGQPKNDIRMKILIINALGDLALKENKYNLALDYYEQSLQLARDINNLKLILHANTNLSNVYRTQGFLEKALQFLNEALAFQDEIVNLETQGVMESNLGIIYYHLAQYNAAEEHFLKAIEILSTYNAEYHISELLFYYLLTLRETSKSHDFQENLNFFKELNDRTENPIINFRYNLASAIYYYDQNSLISKAEAMKILSQLQDSNLNDEFFSLLSSIHACSLFMDELLLFFDIDVINKVKSIIENLETIAKKQDSHLLEVEVSRLIAKLEKLEGNTSNSEHLMTMAISKAEKYHLIHLKNKINEDRVKLLEDRELFPSDAASDNHQLNPIMYKEQLYSYQIFLHPIRLCVFKELINNWTISSAELRKLIKTSWGKLLTHISKMEEEGMIEYKNGFEGGSVVKIIELTHYGESKYTEFKKFMEYNL